ncbi:MAG: FkbM family methyltransferase, partial [Pirellula sp.]|nr:FkbM family methyltransferase [Pirellula sp.]
MDREYPEWTSKIRFVKVDTEGFDLEVLRSLETTLVRQRPYIHVEFYKHLSTDRRKMLWGYLNRLGYQIYTTDPEHNIDPHERVEESDVTKWDHFDAIA